MYDNLQFIRCSTSSITRDTRLSRPFVSRLSHTYSNVFRMRHFNRFAPVLIMHQVGEYKCKHTNRILFLRQSRTESLASRSVTVWFDKMRTLSSSPSKAAYMRAVRPCYPGTNASTENVLAVMIAIYLEQHRQTLLGMFVSAPLSTRNFTTSGFI